MVRRGNHDTIDLRHFIEHLAIVDELPRLGIAGEHGSGILRIDVAQRDDVFAFELFQIVSALPTDANPGEMEPVRLPASRYPNQVRGQGQT